MLTTRCAYILFIITNSLSDYSNKFNVLFHKQPGSETVHKILQTYRSFYKNVHVDNGTEYIANQFLALYSTQITIYNYDTLNNEKLLRPAAVRCLHMVIFQNPLRFAKYLENHSNIFSTDVIVFLTTDPTLSLLKKNYNTLPNLSKSGRTVILNFAKPMQIYTICSYCGPESDKFIPLQQEPDVDTHNLLPNDFENLNGHLLKIGYIDYFPYIYCVKKEVQDEKIICNHAVGSEFELLKTLSEKMNFTFKLMQELNSSYEIILNNLLNGVYDFAVGGISLTNSRRQVLQFSTVLRFEDIAFMFDYQRPIRLKLFLLGAIFNTKIGTSMITAMLLLILLLYYVMKYFNKKASITKVVQVITRSTFEQPVKLKSFIPDTTKITVLILLTSYWIFTLIMNTVYKSEVTASTVQMSPPATTLEELIKEGYRIVVDKSLENYLTDEEKEFITQKPIIKKHNNLCDLVAFIESHKAIIPGEIARHLYHIELHCRVYLPKPLHHFTSKFFTVTPHAVPFKTGVPFVNSFDWHIQQINNGGLLKMWKRQTLLENLHHYKLLRKRKHPSTNHSEMFYMQFAIYLIMLSFCVVCFCVEFAYSHCKNRPP